MGVHHVFHAVGNQIAAGQRIEHPAVPHGDAVVHGDGVEFFGNRACFFNFAGNKLPHVVQVHMAGHELGERVGDGDDGLAKVAVGNACGAPKGARACHVASVGGGFGAVVGHGCVPLFVWFG